MFLCVGLTTNTGEKGMRRSISTHEREAGDASDLIPNEKEFSAHNIESWMENSTFVFHLVKDNYFLKRAV